MSNLLHQPFNPTVTLEELLAETVVAAYWFYSKSHDKCVAEYERASDYLKEFQRTSEGVENAEQYADSHRAWIYYDMVNYFKRLSKKHNGDEQKLRARMNAIMEQMHRRARCGEFVKAPNF